ncbi:aminoglycoside phosphotransferase family protein [Fluoribacter gormanii]|uniref:Aminoglycoside phosphotransferase n=1 Tax=Fluoribacter gormanii TaxID=464 RepID=A0A377GNE0_9GAMM|nr:aminoglycoside phosphotransferase family protein [Fluoribacter gormanii]KTD03842.1 aminoglycoside phosphotransferase [Fluoribacter gormanii]SIR86771.1 Predicted kinase, aminoglycoside phosphotransferase (APT) family [Fluoribacter gormanii]STO26320.1 Aminoglycoside phosphotransferase [Fluoribacter gormanii]
MRVPIDVSLVRRLIDSQFPQWANLPIKPVAFSGWDNRTFHLGTEMTVRLPSAAFYALQVEKEQCWLPYLAPHLTLAIPSPIAKGEPAEGYLWQWSIYRWIDGQTVSLERVKDLSLFAEDLAKFLLELQTIDTAGGPLAGEHSFYRGGPLITYDAEVQEAIKILTKQTDTTTLSSIWSEALAQTWQKDPVWVHGDIAVGNLLIQGGRLCAVIDFGQLAIGDPACDLVIAWTFLTAQSREVFRRILQPDNATWARARGWALWKALIVCAALPGTNPLDIVKSWSVIEAIIADYNNDN